MAKDKNTYAKRQRETMKRQKAEAKRDRRRKRKEGTDGGNSSSGEMDTVWSASPGGGDGRGPDEDFPGP